MLTGVKLERRFGLLQATALNMSNMIGIGPFITIPLLMTALGGPQALLGWLVALVIVVADGMVWAELGAMLPGSGGHLPLPARRLRVRAVRPADGVPLHLAVHPQRPAGDRVGLHRLCQLRPLHPARTSRARAPSGWPTLVGVVNIALLYRRIDSIGTLTVTLWVGTLVTTLAVIVTGAFHFDPAIAFDVPEGAFHFSTGFLFGLGAAARVGIYDYLGYYNICYIGDEVRDPGRVIPRSILISVLAVAVIYIAINLSIIGVVPWREFVPNTAHPQSDFIVSIFMERIYGSNVATAFTLLVLWTAFGSVFALLLGYSRIPYAAATDGTFFRVFAKVHPEKHFPHVSLLLIGAIAIVASTLPLGHGDRRADHDAHPDSVHGPDRRGRAPATRPAGPGTAVPDLAVPAAEPGGAGRMGVRVLDVGRDRDPLRPGDAAGRAGRVRALDLAHRAVAVPPLDGGLTTVNLQPSNG